MPNHPSGPRKKRKKGKPPKGNPEQDGNHAPGEPTITIPPAPANASQPKKGSYNDIPWWKRWDTGWKRIIETIGIAFGVTYAVVTYCQWRDLKHNFALEQRPYVVPFSDQISTEVKRTPRGYYIRADFPLHNFGKSPALHVFSIGEVLVGDDARKQADDWFVAMGLPLRKTYDPRDGFYEMGNGVGIVETSVMPDAKSAFEALQLKNISDAQPSLPALIVARIQYEDADGNFYWTDTCNYIADQSTLGQSGSAIVTPKCAFHNEIH